MQKLQDRIKYIKQITDPKNLVNVGYPVFVDNTPIRSGNARSKTRKTAASIDANYAYATRLDEGWSKQSPQGMVKPTVEFLKKYIQQRLSSSSFYRN